MFGTNKSTKDRGDIMNTLSILKMSVEILSTGFTNHTLPLKSAPRSANADPAWKAATENGKGSRGASSAKAKLQLGDAVRHSRHGVGRVLAHWADGTILVRFDNLAQNQLIWPPFLDRVDGQRS
jgi:hypothetical protein